MWGLSLVAANGGHSSSRCAGLSLSRPLLLRGTGSRRAGSVIVAHRPSCSMACGIFPDQGSNPCPLHWQADSQPLRHQGSPACMVNSQETVIQQTFMGGWLNTKHRRNLLKIPRTFLVFTQNLWTKDPVQAPTPPRFGQFFNFQGTQTLSCNLRKERGWL